MTTQTVAPSPFERSPSPEKEPLAPEARLGSSARYVHNIALDTVMPSETYATLRSEAKLPGVEAFSQAAELIGENTDNELDPFDRSLLRVTSKLGKFIDAEETLNTLRKERSREKDHYGDISPRKKQMIENYKVNYVIPFNREVKQLIVENPDMNSVALGFNLSNAYASLYSQYDTLKATRRKKQVRLQDLNYNLISLIDGMKHEVAVKKMLKEANIPYDDDTTAHEDTHGSDIFVLLNDKWYGLDIKASPNAEMKAHMRHHDSMAVWTGLDDSDFTGTNGDAPGSVSIPSSVAKEKSAALLDRIYETISGETNRYHRTSQHFGHHALAHY